MVYAASKSEIRMFPLEDDLEPDTDLRQLSAPEDHFMSIKLLPPVQLQGLLMRRAKEQDHFYCVFETEDHQLDFNTLTVFSDDFRYELKQLRPIEPRQVSHDPVTKFSTVFDSDGLNHSAALRRSG